MPSLKVGRSSNGGGGGDTSSQYKDLHGLQQANRLVQSIFHQITEGDAPSSNFVNSSFSTHQNHQKTPSRLPVGKKATSSANTIASSGGESSQSDYIDTTSLTTASMEERSFSSSSAVAISSPFASPKPNTLTSRFPPRPPPSSSSSSQKNREISDASNHSTNNSNNMASSYSIGASLMGTMALADLCSRTIETSSAVDKGGCDGPTSSYNNILGPMPPLPLSSLEGESDGTTKPTGSFDRTNNNQICTPKVSNGEGYGGKDDAPSFNMMTPSSCDDQGFPCNDNNNNIEVTLNTDNSWNTTDARTTSSFNKFVMNNPTDAGQKRRITMFGSEYAKILSSSKPPTTSSPATGYGPSSSANKVKRSSNAVSNKIKARFSSSMSVAQSYATSTATKESVESGGNSLLSLDECSNSVATAAITDVIVTSGNDIPPRGYYRAFQLGEESTKNMVPGRKRQRLYLNVKKEPSWDRAAQRPCVTAFCIIYPDRNEFVPPGFSVVRHYQPTNSGSSSGADGGGGNKKKEGSSTASKNRDQPGSSVSPAANINLSSSGERVYICYRRSREGNPITGLICLRPCRGDVIPEGYTVLERTPRNYLADMAAKTDQPLFLAYRQRLENLECLRPLPLVLSVLHSRPDAGRKELKAYFCTGGTVVSSDVGRYHIMDRTTHTLMSSSSAQSRLNLIQSSRKESETAVPAWVSSSSTHSSSSQINANRRHSNSASSSVASPGQNDDASESSGMHPQTSNQSFDSCFDNFSKSPSQNSLASIATSNSDQQSISLTKSTSPGTLFSHSDDTLQTTLDAMHFIPPVECANTEFQLDDATHSSILQSRIAIITPVLTSCYTSQGGSSLLAVEGLISLLNETDFFAQDVADDDGNSNSIVESSVRLTILDLAIQAVCDVATTSARETYFRSCVDFVSDAVRYASGKLNDRTIGFVLRFYLFIFYFGASVPTNGWPFNTDDDFLLSDGMEQDIEGGAPQAAAIALKEFVSIMLSRIGTGLEKAECHSLKTAPDESPETHARKILTTLVENAMSRVDVANYTQLAMYQIHRSGGSELFWHDMLYSIGEGLFGQVSSPSTSTSQATSQGVIHSNTIAFAILTSFVKICSGKVRMIFLNTEPVPRDVASKLLSFELLLHFLKMWRIAVSAENIIGCGGGGGSEEATCTNAIKPQCDDGIESVATMVYVVRRLVPTLLLSNTSAAIEDYRVYRRVLRVITQLWCNPYYRCQMKMELAVLIEHYVLRVLCLGPQVKQTKQTSSSEDGEMPSLLRQQQDVLDEIKVWFSSNPNDAVNLYINYDNQGDMMLPPSYCNLMNKICEALSTLAEQCGTIISEHGRFASINGDNGSPRKSTKQNDKSNANAREAAQSTREKAFDAITAIAKSMMDSAGTQNEKQMAVEDVFDDSAMDESLERNISVGIGLSPQLSPIKAAKSYEDENIIDYWKTIEKRKAPLQPLLLTSSYDLESPLSFSIKPSVSEDSSKKAQLQKNKQDSLDVAFELIATKGLKKGIDYLIASRLLTSSPRHISAFLRIHQSSIDAGILGEYLGEGGVDGADVDFFNLIRFNFARATSFVGMNVEQAIRHYLTDCGFRLPGEAQKIDRIISTFSQCYWEDNAGDIQKCPFSDSDTVFLISFAIIMLNTDLHKSHGAKGKAAKRMTKNEFITNLRGVCQVDKFRDYIYSIYDSIESKPIVISESSATPNNEMNNQWQGSSSSLPFMGQTDFASCMQSWVKSVKPAQELLRTVAVRHDNFDMVVYSEAEDENSLEASTRQMFSANWHHIHAAINSVIDNAHLDLAGLGCCIDALEFSLCAASYLGMTVERSAFSKLLGRVNRFNDLKVKKEKKLKSNDTLNKAKPDGQLDFEDVGQVRSLTKKLHTSLIVDNMKVNEIKQVASRIRNGDILLNDPSRTFVREGDLIKRHQLAGRSSTYRFFLFSDVLVYAHKSSQGDYKVHEELPLHLMKVEDGGTNAKETGFHIHHPNKSFLVVASTKEEKQQWITDINTSITREVKRKAKIEKSRIEVARRAKD